MQQMDERIESLRESITSTSSTRQKLENQIELLKEQIHTAEMTDEHLQSRLLAIEKEKAQRLKSRKEYDDKKAALEAEIEQMRLNELLAVNEHEAVLAEVNRCNDGLEKGKKNKSKRLPSSFKSMKSKKLTE